MISLTVNGQKQQFQVEDDTPLLWVLRDFAKLTGTKYGCGKGLCGACTVLLDGQAIRSCITPIALAKNKTVTTIEGLSDKGDHPLQKAWEEINVPQCGYCQAGQIMSAAALLQQKPDPNDDEINTAMAGNLCRCGTYNRIRTAVKRAAELAKEVK